MREGWSFLKMLPKCSEALSFISQIFFVVIGEWRAIMKKSLEELNSKFKLFLSEGSESKHLLKEFRTYEMDQEESRIVPIRDLKTIQGKDGSFMIFGGTMIYFPVPIDWMEIFTWKDEYESPSEDLEVNRFQQIVLKELGIQGQVGDLVWELEEDFLRRFGELKFSQFFNFFTNIQSTETFLDFVHTAWQNSPAFLLGNLLWEEKAIEIHSEADGGELSAYSNVVQGLLRQFRQAGFERIMTASRERKWVDKQQKRLPEYVFHGTSARSFVNIMKRGLRPATVPANGSASHNNSTDIKAVWNVFHQEHVFVTSEMETAEGYARIAGERKKEQAIVLRLKLPDPSLLEPDYDAYAQTHPDVTRNKGYEVPEYEGQIDRKVRANNLRTNGLQQTSRATTASNHIGKWGYRGTIPPKYILAVYMESPQDQGEFDLIAPQGIATWLKSIEEVGGEEIGSMVFGDSRFAGDWEYDRENYFPDDEEEEDQL